MKVVKRALWVAGLMLSPVFLAAPQAKAGSYQLQSVSYYFPDAVSSDIYNLSAGQGSISVTANVSGSGTGQNANAWASGSLGLQGGGGASVSKTYVWVPNGTAYQEYQPAPYYAIYENNIQAASSVQASGACYGNAGSSLVGNNQTFSSNTTTSYLCSGQSQVTLGSYHVINAHVDANVYGAGSVTASLTQSVTFDVNIGTS